MEYKHTVFVYGTLLSGEANHSLLDDSEIVGNGHIFGYKMYDIGFYPGIIPGEGTVLGELYKVTDETLIRLDWLEGEGSLYIRKSMPVHLESGEACDAFIYEYNHNIDGLQEIPAWLQPYTSNWKAKKSNYVWYVSYGSNMLFDRFICYIRGEQFEEGVRKPDPCNDLSDPVAKMNIDIPYNMYFRNESRSWDYMGVSFLDIHKPGSSLGVAYLITREQYEHVFCQENGGNEPEDCPNWYNKACSLGFIDGYEVVTITNSETKRYNAPSEKYINTLKRGLRENYSDMSDEDIDNYLARCMENR